MNWMLGMLGMPGMLGMVTESIREHVVYALVASASASVCVPLLRMIAWAVAWSFASLLCTQRVYNTHDSRRDAKEVLRICDASTRVLRLGVQSIVDGDKVTSLVVGVGTLVHVSTYDRGIHGARVTEIAVWRWRGLGTLVPDPPIRPPPSTNSIRVISVSDNSKQGTLCDHIEVCMLPSVTDSVRAFAEAVAQRIVAMCARDTADGFQSFVVCVHGAPAIGKTLAGRLVTRMLKGYLYVDYDPTKACPGNCMNELTDDWALVEAPLVVMGEEFDGSLRAIMQPQRSRQDAPAMDDYVPDATGKGGLNKLLGRIHMQFNSVYILTTNATVEDLWELCRDDETGEVDTSILREGRVRGHFVPTGDERVVEMRPPITLADAARMNGLRRSLSVFSRPHTPPRRPEDVGEGTGGGDPGGLGRRRLDAACR